VGDPSRVAAAYAAIYDVCGVVLDVEVTTGEVNEGQFIIERIDAA
jgi:hypothetical protein